MWFVDMLVVAVKLIYVDEILKKIYLKKWNLTKIKLLKKIFKKFEVISIITDKNFINLIKILLTNVYK